jgi:hypothetical protein
MAPPLECSPPLGAFGKGTPFPLSYLSWDLKPSLGLFNDKNLLAFSMESKLGNTALPFPISHLLFPNDILIFRKATSIEASSIKSCLDSYCAWSGQKVIMAKSSIHFSKNTLPSTINSIKGIIPFKNTSISASYLGLPLFIGKSKNQAFQPILDKVLKKKN